MKPERKSPSMLTRLLVMFNLVIILAVLLMLAVFTISSRQAQIDNRVAALKAQAYDIAYLAGSREQALLDSLGGYTDSPTRAMMERKLREVYQDYSAYCLVVDRLGRMTGYFSDVISQHAQLSAQWNTEQIATTLVRVLKGQEVIAQTQGAEGPMFTVAVPWVQDGMVVGAVYIQTAAQTLQTGYEGIWQKATLAALFTALVAAAIAVFYTRRLGKPLKNMAVSAGIMAKGLKAPQVEESGFAELDELATAFNHMSSQIQDTEENRKAFIANLSHELRSPMTSIQGFVQGLVDETVPENDRTQTLNIVLDETKRLNRLVSGLMVLSRAEAGQGLPHPQAFNVCELIRLVLITRIQALEGKELEVVTLFDQEEMYARGARDQIEQVLINLVDNAIRYTPQGGKITLSVKENDKKTLAVTVADNGLGITKEDAPRVFERFYKAEKAHTAGEGVGLGLAIVKAILERHGQSIRLLDTKEGAAFEFTLEKAEKNGRQHGAESARED